MNPDAPHILILAAGKGKRMKSTLPKVLHPVMFRPMVHYVIDLAKSIPHSSITVVVGHGEQAVREACERYPEVKFVTQAEQKGTAHAVQSAKDLLSSGRGRVVVLSGDVILLGPETLRAMICLQAEERAAGVILTARPTDPTGYGRVIRSERGEVAAIREQADCSTLERGILEVNAGVYCFELDALKEGLAGIHAHNQQKEFYLTDVVQLLGSHGKRVLSHSLSDATEMTGINDRVALREVERILRARRNQALMMGGVTLRDPETTTIDLDSRIENDVTIEGGCVVLGSTISSGSVVEQGCRITSSQVAAGCRIKQGSYLESSRVGPDCSVGPYAHFRPGTVLGAGVKIGNFVEVKNASFASGAKASHLSYIGDAEIGENVNLGCGFVTCNYDGVKKHKTIIERDVFVGSDSQTVAPVRIGAGAYVASGTTVTEDVPPDALALSRGRQVIKEGYAKKYRKT